jgi:thiazole synthase
MKDQLEIAGKKFSSRLLIGTGKFSSSSIMTNAIKASDAEIVTVAVRRMDLNNPKDNFLNLFENSQYQFLPNTSGARNAEEAIKIAKIIKALNISNWIKLEVTPEPNYLLPDPIETLKAAEALVKLGFIVLPTCKQTQS